MLSQQCLVELELSDKVQLAVETGTGIVDASSHHLTQFVGILLRPSQECFKAAVKAMTEEEGVNFSEGFRGLTPIRSFTPGRTVSPPLPGWISIRNQLLSFMYILVFPDVSLTLEDSQQFLQVPQHQHLNPEVAAPVDTPTRPKKSSSNRQPRPQAPAPELSQQQSNQPPQNSASSTPTQPAKGGFYSFLKR